MTILFLAIACDPRIAAGEAMTVAHHQPEPARMPAEPLTPREGEVLALLGRGSSCKGIARALGLTPGTVKWHTRNLYAKLDAYSREDALSRARELRILS